MGDADALGHQHLHRGHQRRRRYAADRRLDRKLEGNSRQRRYAGWHRHRGGAVIVDSGGTFAPGDPSTLTVAGLTLNSGATFDEEIGGAAPGSGGTGGYDQTVVENSGTISLGGATLDVSLVNSFAPSVGESFTIINNETGKGISGTFNGLAQGATFEADSTWFQISYDAGAQQ